MDEHILILLIKERDKSIDERELNVLNSWRAESAEREWEYRKMVQLFEKSGSISYVSKTMVRRDWKRVRERIGKSNQNRFYGYAAASISAILLLGYLVWPQLDRTINYSTYKSADTVNTVYLPDSTLITLNSGAWLSVSNAFGVEKRAVHLEGEAYFEVHKDPDHPFIIHSGQTLTTVLGTAFNLETRSGVSTLTVVEGWVSFQSGGVKLTLTAGQSAVLRNDQLVEIPFNPNELAWRTHHLKYNHTSLEIVLKDLAEVYGVEFDLKIKKHQLQVTSEFDQEDLASVLEELAIILPIKISNVGDHYRIDPK